MCRNITMLRGLEPRATSEEIEAAARQYVRKISGVLKPTPATAEAFERAVLAIAEISTSLLADLPPRKQPPPTLPPLRRIAIARGPVGTAAGQPRPPAAGRARSETGRARSGRSV